MPRPAAPGRAATRRLAPGDGTCNGRIGDAPALRHVLTWRAVRRARLGFGSGREDAVSRGIGGPWGVRDRLGRRRLGRLPRRLGNPGKVAGQQAGLAEAVRGGIGDGAREPEKVAAKLRKIALGARYARLEGVPEGAGGVLRGR
jgi:hypothetical protein